MMMMLFARILKQIVSMKHVENNANNTNRLIDKVSRRNASLADGERDVDDREENRQKQTNDKQEFNNHKLSIGDT